MIGRFFKNVLIPEKVGSYYLLPKRIIGFDINKTNIYATQLVLNARTITLEKFIDQPLELEPTAAYPDRVAQTIKTILKKVDRYDEIRTSLSSSMAIFKELTLPFTDTEKIAMVLNYEMEPYLPFPINQAVLDFIITQINPAQQTAIILVAAVRKEHIAEHLNYFEQAGVSPQTITVDLFDLYGLYKLIPRYAQDKGNNVLIDIGFNVTRIAYIIDGRLTLVRTLAKGILQWAKVVAQEINITPNEALERIIRFGFEHHDDQKYNNAIKDAVSSFLNDIKFTLNSFIMQTKTEQPIDKILLLGHGADIQHITAFFNKQLDITCELFEVNELLKTNFVKTKHEKRIPRSAILSLSTALITSTMESFNLRRQEFSVVQKTVFIRQFVTATLLIVSAIAGLLIHNFWQMNKLKKTAQKYESQIVDTLNKSGLSKAKGLTEALRQAQEKVNQEESIWFAFSSQTRFSFLKYLQDLSIAIDREGIGLNLKKLEITEQEPRTLILEGEVLDYDALKVLERELKKSNMFVSVPSLQLTKFKITLELKKNGELNS